MPGKLSRLLLLLTLGFPISLMADSLPDYSSIVEAVIPSVVTITTSGKDTLAQSEATPILNETDEPLPFLLNTALSNSCSGFVFSETGYILTNAHVVQSADTISVQLHDGSRYLAQVVGLDELADIALLKIPANNLKPVVLSEKINELKVGQTVLGIGSPYSFEYSVTSGIISYLGRTLASAGVQNNSASYIQTDMLINPGNSGGPIINGEGEVIGMSSRIFSTTGASIGISFGIPVNIIGQIVECLLSEEGTQKRGFGLMTASINPEQIQQFGLQRNIGALITLLEPEGPAFKCGLRVNDVIVTVDGNIIRSSEEFQYQMSVLSLAEPIRVTVIRNGRYFATHIKLPDVIEI